ncbi:MAG: NfeD family protein [Archaeoglobaceae archaeon]
MLSSLSRILVVLFLIIIVIPSVQSADVVEVEISGEINEGSVATLEKAFEVAEREDADAILVVIDTPGGLVSSMRNMVEQTLNSDRPVITYVYPRGAFAASAGSFILISGDIAAMSNGTSTGAATPIGMVEPAENKTINFIASYARSIAERRDRPVDVVEKFVTEGVSLSAEEAYREGVVDVLADSKESLFSKLDGRTIVFEGRNVTLDLDEVNVITVEKPLRAEIFGLLSNPQVASILLLIGIYGLIFGLTSPGVLPESVGAICLVLSLIGLLSGNIDISYIGILLLLLAIVFLVAELLTPTYGVLGAASVICVALGSIMLYREPLMPREFYSSFPQLMAGISIGIAGIMTFLIIKVAQLRKSLKRVGGEALIGIKGEVSSFENGEGYAKIRGEVWKIKGEEDLKKGDRVTVKDRDGLTLYVTREESRESDQSKERTGG